MGQADEGNVDAYMESSISRLTPKEQTQFLALFNKFVGG